jgi:hypothetical protein
MNNPPTHSDVEWLDEGRILRVRSVGHATLQRAVPLYRQVDTLISQHGRARVYLLLDYTHALSFQFSFANISTVLELLHLQRNIYRVYTYGLQDRAGWRVVIAAVLGAMGKPYQDVASEKEALMYIGLELHALDDTKS